MSETIAITLNGAEHRTAAPDVAALLAELHLEPERVVAEVDGKVLRPEDFVGTPLYEGVVIELLRFVGGG